jgi:hypothetical protein
MSNFVPNSSLVLSQVHSPIIVPLAWVVSLSLVVLEFIKFNLTLLTFL